MATCKVIIYISISLALCIGFTNGQGYSYIPSAIVRAIYNKLGYGPNDAPERWVAEGVAIDSALNYIDTLETSVFSTKGGIEFIVGTTGGNTSTYICGLTKRLGNSKIPDNQIPSEIYIVYTLNYVSGFGEVEHVNFRQKIDALIEIAKKHDKKPKVHVRNFRPLSINGNKLQKEDYPDYKNTTMEEAHIRAQLRAICDLHKKVTLKDSEIIGCQTFRFLINDLNVMKIVDGVVGSGEQKVTKDNQLLLAIPTSQINIMSEAICMHKAKQSEGARGRVIVICNDNPSGMNDNGDWTIDTPFPVDYILSCLCHKKLVNSDNFVSNPKAIVLDITFRGVRLLENLQAELLKLTTRDVTLEDDVNTAIAVKKGVIFFKIRMVVVPD